MLVVWVDSGKSFLKNPFGIDEQIIFYEVGFKIKEFVDLKTNKKIIRLSSHFSPNFFNNSDFIDIPKDLIVKKKIICWEEFEI